jgi:hypothetical protein
MRFGTGVRHTLTSPIINIAGIVASTRSQYHHFNHSITILGPLPSPTPTLVSVQSSFAPLSSFHLLSPSPIAFFGSQGCSERHTRGSNKKPAFHSRVLCKSRQAAEQNGERPTVIPYRRRSFHSYLEASKMKGPGLFRLLSFIFFVSFVAAWPWPESFNDIEDLIVRRQESSSAGMSNPSCIFLCSTDSQSS